MDDLNHLYRGGRVSKTAAFLGTIINIKPVLHVDDEGHLIPLSKVRGRKKSLITLVDSMEKQMGSYRDQNDIVFISHGDSIEDAEFVAGLVKKRFGIESFLINYVGPTIGAHSGRERSPCFIWGNTADKLNSLKKGISDSAAKPQRFCPQTEDTPLSETHISHIFSTHFPSAY